MRAPRVIDAKDKLSRIGSGLRTAAASFAKNESGATAIEYALLCLCISVATIGAWRTIASTLNDTFTDAGTTMTTQVAGE